MLICFFHIGGWARFFQIKLSSSFLQSGVGARKVFFCFERPFLEKLRHAPGILHAWLATSLLVCCTWFSAWLPHHHQSWIIKHHSSQSPIPRNTKCRCWVLRSMSQMKADTWRCVFRLFGVEIHKNPPGIQRLSIVDVIREPSRRRTFGLSELGRLEISVTRGRLKDRIDLTDSRYLSHQFGNSGKIWQEFPDRKGT